MLREIHKKRIESCATHYRKYLESEQGKEELRNLEGHQKALQHALDDASMTGSDFLERLKKTTLHISGYTGEEQALEQSKSNNNSDNVMQKLRTLRAGSLSLPLQFESIDGIWGMGSSQSSVIMSLLYPDRCAIWSAEITKGLQKLGFTHDLPLEKKQLTYLQYDKFNRYMSAIREELKSRRLGEHSMAQLAIFLTFVGRQNDGVGK